MHQDFLLTHWSAKAHQSVCDRCLGPGGDAEGHDTVCIFDAYDDRKVEFENSLVDLEKSRQRMDEALLEYPKMKQSIVTNASKKEEQARTWFAQVRAVLDEKEKEWAVKLKESEAEKLGENNTQLERLTWFRNDVDGQHCDSSELLFDRDMYAFFHQVDAECDRISKVLDKAASREILPKTHSDYEVGLNVQPPVDAIDMHMGFVLGTGQFTTAPPKRNQGSNGTGTFPSFSAEDLAGFGSLEEKLRQASEEAEEQMRKAGSAGGSMGGSFGGMFSNRDDNEEARCQVIQEEKEENAHHPGTFGSQTSMMPGWSCCFQQYEGAPGCKEGPKPRDKSYDVPEEEDEEESMMDTLKNLIL